MEDLEAIQLAENMRLLQEKLAGDAAGLLALNQIASGYRDADTALQRERTNTLTDSLTGMPNRRAFDQDVNWGAAHNPGGFDSNRPVVIGRGLAMYDLDHFKAINDTMGHAQGDRVLRVSAMALRLVHREGDRSYRLGGDEFATLMPLYEPTDPEAGIPKDDPFALMLRQRFMEEVELISDGRYKTILMMNNFGPITDMDKEALEILNTSVGVVTQMGSSVNYPQMLAAADEKMYAMKKARKGGR